MNQYLYKIQPVRTEMLTEGPTAEEAEQISAHFLYLKELTETGAVLLAGRTLTTDPESFGIVIYQAAGDAEAEHIMNNDPAVKNGVFSGCFFPFGIALLADSAGWCE